VSVRDCRDHLICTCFRARSAQEAAQCLTRGNPNRLRRERAGPIFRRHNRPITSVAMLNLYILLTVEG
jgi:hypothetical protein